MLKVGVNEDDVVSIWYMSLLLGGLEGGVGLLRFIFGRVVRS